jgi:hypothetical protein
VNPADEWISAATAVALLKPAIGTFSAQRTIANRAADSLIRSRAQRFIRESSQRTDVQGNVELPAKFWWARGESALRQNWETGDFDTWVTNSEQWRAFNVQFSRTDIEQQGEPHLGGR